MKGWILYNAAAVRGEHYSAHRLLEAGKDIGFDLQIVEPEMVDIVVTKDSPNSIVLNGEYTDLPDFVIPRMGVSTSYYALALLRHLERLNVCTFNSARTIELVKDKLHTEQILARNKLPVPKTMLVKFPVDVDLVEAQLGFPVVIKTLSGTLGVGVFLSESKQKFVDLMELITALRSTATILLQEFIEDSRGTDLRVLVVGGRVVGCMQRCSTDGNFKANISRGGIGKPFKATPEIEWLATETTRILNLDIAGVDLLFDGEHFKICEANSAPGFEGIDKYLGKDIATEILKFVRIRLGQFN